MRKLTALGLIAITACGSPETSADSAPETDSAAEPAAPAASRARPTGELTVPDWFVADASGESIQLDIVAGATDERNYWNYNGFVEGQIAITVPLGATVTIDFENRDPIMAHSIGVSAETESFGAPPQPDPVFAGAISENPASMMGATLTGESETIEFVADQAGEYTLVCYIAGHTAVGMWIYFVVSESGEFGVRGM